MVKLRSTNNKRSHLTLLFPKQPWALVGVLALSMLVVFFVTLPELLQQQAVLSDITELSRYLDDSPSQQHHHHDHEHFYNHNNNVLATALSSNEQQDNNNYNNELSRYYLDDDHELYNNNVLVDASNEEDNYDNERNDDNDNDIIQQLQYDSNNAASVSTATNSSKRQQHDNNNNNNSSIVHQSCLDPNKAQPYILMSKGRSGSTSTWQLIGNLTGMETGHLEFPGSNTKKQLKFFQLWQAKKFRKGEWILHMLCSKQRQYKDAKVVGFKWKPYTPKHPEFLAAMDLIAQSRNPSIKIVRLRRNPLDVFLSTRKHEEKKKIPNHGGIQSKCKTGDTQCIQRHIIVGSGLELDSQELLQYLKRSTREEDEIDLLLKTKGIPHVSVSYEKLFHNGNDVSEWSHILDFLVGGSAKRKPLTKGTIDNAMALAATSHRNHSLTIKNYPDIKMALANTEFEHLLHG